MVRVVRMVRVVVCLHRIDRGSIRQFFGTDSVKFSSYAHTNGSAPLKKVCSQITIFPRAKFPHFWNLCFNFRLGGPLLVPDFFGILY